jgi:hypothetical protein
MMRKGGWSGKLARTQGSGSLSRRRSSSRSWRSWPSASWRESPNARGHLRVNPCFQLRPTSQSDNRCSQPMTFGYTGCTLLCITDVDESRNWLASWQTSHSTRALLAIWLKPWSITKDSCSLDAFSSHLAETLDEDGNFANGCAK